MKKHAQRRGKGFTCHVAFDTGTGVLAGPRHMVEALKQDAWDDDAWDGPWMALGKCDGRFWPVFVQRKPWIFLVKHDVFLGESWQIPRKNGWFEVRKMGENA